jgi:predicted nuclease of predicted toxin-antitoxin system
MKLLLDANISWKLVNMLQNHSIECAHVDKCSLDKPAKDIEIWNFAFANGYIIVTNDEDFLNFSNTKGYPPKLVLLRSGNKSTRFVFELLLKHRSAIKELFIANEYGILEIV